MGSASDPDVVQVEGREPFSGGTQAYSGATFERAVLRDGRRVVLKHLPAEGDWLTRATNGIGRARLLWESGLLDRVAPTVEHAVVDVFDEDGHDVVAMRDVSDVLLKPDGRVTPSEVHRLLAGLARLHADFEGCELAGLCSPAQRHSLCIPAMHRADDGPNGFRVRDHVLAGWESFAEQWPEDVVGAIFAIHDEPGLLDRAFGSTGPWTLLHGDARLENLGLRGDDLVAIDWGELTGTGPAEMDLAWFAAIGTAVLPGAPTWRIDATPDEVFAIYASHSARPLDPRALDVACLGMVAMNGWYFCARMGDEVTVARTAELEGWWLTRARHALDAWSPT